MNLKEVTKLIAKFIKAPESRIYALTELGNGYSYVYKDTRGFISKEILKRLKEKG